MCNDISSVHNKPYVERGESIDGGIVIDRRVIDRHDTLVIIMRPVKAYYVVCRIVNGVVRRKSYHDILHDAVEKMYQRYVEWL